MYIFELLILAALLFEKMSILACRGAGLSGGQGAALGVPSHLSKGLFLQSYSI